MFLLIDKMKNPKLYPWIGFLGAVAVRLFFAHWIQRIDWDGFFYLYYAKNILQGRFFSPDPAWLPYYGGYPLLIAGASFLFHNLETGAYFISQILGAAVIFPLGWLFRRKNTLSYLIMVLLVVFDPLLIRLSNSVLTESAAIFFVTCFFCYLYRVVIIEGFDMKLRDYLPALLFFAAAVAIKPVWLILGGFIVMVGLLFSKSGKRQKYVNAIILSIAVLAIFILSNQYQMKVAEEVYRNYGEKHDSYLCNQLRNIFYKFTHVRLPKSESVENVLLQHSREWANIYFSQWFLWIQGFVWEGRRNLGVLIFPAYWPFCVLSIIRYFKNRSFMGFLLFVMPYMLVMPFFYPGDIRLFAILTPFFLLSTALGIEYCLHKILILFSGLRRFLPFLILILIGPQIFQAARRNIHRNYGYSPVHSAANWLKDYKELSGPIWSNHPSVPYFAGSRVRLLVSEGKMSAPPNESDISASVDSYAVLNDVSDSVVGEWVGKGWVILYSDRNGLFPVHILKWRIYGA